MVANITLGWSAEAQGIHAMLARGEWLTSGWERLRLGVGDNWALGVKLTHELETEANRRQCCCLQLNGWAAAKAGGSGWHQGGRD